MTKRTIFTFEAESDIDQIFDYIAIEKQNPKSAEKLVREIFSKTDQYSRQPEMGELRSDLGAEIRVCRTGSYLIFYRANEEGLLVLRVLHGSRDVEKIFRDKYGLS